jgi:molybdenum-dependent DNA-binding transcriptional regulator ModE
MRIKIAARSTPQELRQLVEAGEPIMVIAQRYEVGRSTMRAHLLANGIPLPRRASRRPRIDIDWLRDQYVVKQRTMKELAAETGVSQTTIGRLINEHADLSRGRGTPSHQASLTAGDGYPHPLASAVLGPGGAARVRRFQVYARTRSLNVAAKRLGVRAQSLTKQLNTLEAACDGRLLERLTRDQRPQELTALGRTLLKQADRQFGVHPDAPQQLPKTLASVLDAFRGREMLHTFVSVADARTLNDAAAARGADPYRLVGTLRNIEVAVGAPLLIEYRPAAPLQLTGVGRRLLRQANEHSSYIQPSARRAATRP